MKTMDATRWPDMGGPRRGQLGEYTFRGWLTLVPGSDGGTCPHCGEQEDGAELGDPDHRVVQEMERLRDSLCSRGWDLQWDMYLSPALVEDGFVCDDPIAYVHIFVGGTDRGYGLRVYPGDYGCPEDASMEQCLEHLIGLLPRHVDDLIELFDRYPYGTVVS